MDNDSNTEGIKTLALYGARKSRDLCVNRGLTQSSFGLCQHWVVWGQKKAHLQGEATVPFLHKGKKNGIYPK